MCTKLDGYDLMYDGSIVVEPSSVLKYLSKVPAEKLYVTHMTDDIESYNRFVPMSNKIKCIVGSSLTIPHPRWSLDDRVANINETIFFKELCDTLKGICENKNSEYAIKAVNRLKQEWALFMDNGLFFLLKALKSCINTFTHNNVVWGPGRGSSTSSYVLFLMGVHDVDCIEYDIDIHDFIKVK